MLKLVFTSRIMPSDGSTGANSYFTRSFGSAVMPDRKASTAAVLAVRPSSLPT